MATLDARFPAEPVRIVMGRRRISTALMYPPARHDPFGVAMASAFQKMRQLSFGV
jgi:hypothetical protein